MFAVNGKSELRFFTTAEPLGRTSRAVANGNPIGGSQCLAPDFQGLDIYGLVSAHNARACNTDVGMIYSIQVWYSPSSSGIEAWKGKSNSQLFKNPKRKTELS